jgi:hypothetical protein
VVAILVFNVGRRQAQRDGGFALICPQLFMSRIHVFVVSSLPYSLSLSKERHSTDRGERLGLRVLRVAQKVQTHIPTFIKVTHIITHLTFSYYYFVSGWSHLFFHSLGPPTQQMFHTVEFKI